MQIKARIDSAHNVHSVIVDTNGNKQQLNVSPKATGYGSSVNGGEFLCVAVATCFCNDLYREAAKRNVKIFSVSVEASAEFGKEGEPGYNIRYSATVEGEASQEELQALVRHTDTVTEIQNTLRRGVAVSLVQQD